MSTRGAPRSMGTATPVAMAIICLVLIASALLNGPSLDDYWTVYLSDASHGIAALVDRRWIYDIHPPLFNAWVTTLSILGLHSVALARLVSNLPALLVLLYAARCFTNRLPGQRAYYAIFLLLTLSAPATIDAFGVLRGSFWQLAGFSIQIMLVRHLLFADKDYRARHDGMLALLAAIATILSITLDYGGALFGGILAMAAVLAAIARGLQRWARQLLVMLLISIAAVVYAVSWQAPAWTESFDLYQNWIEMGSLTAGGIISAFLFGTILHNPLAIAGGYLGRKSWTKEDSAFVVIVGAALVAALVAISQIDAQRRLITASNTSDVAVLVTALMAAAGVKIAEQRMWRNAIAIVAVMSAVVALAVIGLGGGWQTGAKKIARTVRECPATRVYAASGWRVDEGSNSAAARREEAVFTLGYQKLSAAHGFSPIILHPGKPVSVTPGPCPTLLWIEQVPRRRTLKPEQIVKAAGLRGIDGRKLGVIRSDSGLILRAEP